MLPRMRVAHLRGGEVRRQLEYKSIRYKTNLIIANRFYPSSKLCSICDWKNESLTLKDREWTCKSCDTSHDREINAAKNLKRLATRNALPVASQSVTKDTEVGIISTSGGKVTPVSYEGGLKDTSGQEINREHICSLF